MLPAAEVKAGTYELRKVKAPVLTGLPLRLFIRTVLEGPLFHTVVPRLFRDNGYTQVRVLQGGGSCRWQGCSGPAASHCTLCSPLNCTSTCEGAGGAIRSRVAHVPAPHSGLAGGGGGRAGDISRWPGAARARSRGRRDPARCAALLLWSHFLVTHPRDPCSLHARRPVPAGGLLFMLACPSQASATMGPAVPPQLVAAWPTSTMPTWRARSHLARLETCGQGAASKS